MLRGIFGVVIRSKVFLCCRTKIWPRVLASFLAHLLVTSASRIYPRGGGRGEGADNHGLLDTDGVVNRTIMLTVSRVGRLNQEMGLAVSCTGLLCRSSRRRDEAVRVLHPRLRRLLAE